MSRLRLCKYVTAERCKFLAVYFSGTGLACMLFTHLVSFQCALCLLARYTKLPNTQHTAIACHLFTSLTSDGRSIVLPDAQLVLKQQWFTFQRQTWSAPRQLSRCRQLPALAPSCTIMETSLSVWRLNAG